MRLLSVTTTAFVVNVPQIIAGFPNASVRTCLAALDARGMSATDTASTMVNVPSKMEARIVAVNIPQGPDAKERKISQRSARSIVQAITTNCQTST